MEDLPLPFRPVPTRNRYSGWTEVRQVAFVERLAETGSVTESAAYVGMSPASAYRLRVRRGSENFARAWDAALARCGSQLMAMALDRAIHGTRQQYWRDGKLIGERTVPSERLLMWAVDRLTPRSPRATPNADLALAIHAIYQDSLDELHRDYSALLCEKRDAEALLLAERDDDDNAELPDSESLPSVATPSPA